MTGQLWPKATSILFDFIDCMLGNIWLGNEGVGKHPLFENI
jgi:hypothetical protein